jgi:hypothetical protein
MLLLQIQVILSLYVPRWANCFEPLNSDEMMSNNYFIVLDKDGDKVPYKSILAKRQDIFKQYSKEEAIEVFLS